VDPVHSSEKVREAWRTVINLPAPKHAMNLSCSRATVNFLTTILFHRVSYISYGTSLRKGVPSRNHKAYFLLPFIYAPTDLLLLLLLLLLYFIFVKNLLLR
jgi:hypothetical protein